MSVVDRPVDVGTGYGRRPSQSNKELTETGPGTRMGELLRRYWHPIGHSTEATDTPRKVRALGEDLILFRDKTGKPGLVYSRCAHRGTTLYYGKVEERGIRCCYHGWLFDVEGRCLEQPCEPEMGKQHRDKVRQPWYPVEERYGLVFAYMGPPERKPVLPRYEILEDLEPDQYVEPDHINMAYGRIVPCSWTHQWDNVPDHYHVPILHGSFSGIQFVDLMAKMPEVTWDNTDKGVKTVTRRKLDNNKILLRITEGLLPNVRAIPDPTLASGMQRCESMSWVLPVDDTNYRMYTAYRWRKGQERKMARPGGKSWLEMTPDEHQKFPDDWEAQTGQGEITLHSEEHLATTDKGIVMLRRMLLKQADLVAEGKDPIGVSFDENAPPLKLEAGNYVVDA